MRGWLRAVLAAGLLVACAPPQMPEPPQPSGGWLPARVRRLSNAEYEQSAAHLLRMPVEVQRRLPPDLRQPDGYTRNAQQAVMPSSGPRLAAIAEGLAESAVERRLAALMPCAERDAACRNRALEQLAVRAFRRPLDRAELEALQAVFEVAAGGGDLAAGVQAVLSALLQSPSFLYVTELGTPRRAQVSASRALAELVRLNDYELASWLSFTIRGGPPDAELMRAAARGRLREPGERERQARRLLSMHDTRHHFRRFVLQWLEVDELMATAKSEAVFAGYEMLKPLMLAETERFVDEVMVRDGASVASLLDAGFASVDMKMAAFYGLPAFGTRVPSRDYGRVGVLQHASFLAAHAHPDSTSPVLRGDFVARKLLCVRLPRPSELDIEVIMPRPSSELTTRERFAQHVANPDCRFCHRVIDGYGYTFESFDAAGRRRSEENGKPINTVGEGALQGQPYRFRNSQELARWLAGNARVHECFARHAFRYFSAQHSPDAEAVFLRTRERLPASKKNNLIEVLVAWVQSEHFVTRQRAAQGISVNGEVR